MNNTRELNYGIDVVINDIQTSIYEELQTLWTNNILGNGRVYKNRYENRLGLYTYDNNDNYKEMYFQDNYDCVFLFIDSDNHTTDDQMVFSSDVDIVFMVNLENIASGNDRNDSKVQWEVVKILKNISDNRFEVNGITKGIDNVFRGFNIESIKNDDMHPFHIFSVNTKLYYYLDNKC